MPNRYPYWLYANLLSLDAPIVATVWVWIFAKTLRVVHIAPSSYWMLAAAIWCVYVIDRVVDVWKRGGDRSEQVIHAFDVNDRDRIERGTRHAFHWRNRSWLLILVGIVLLVAGYAAFEVISDALLSVGLAGAGFVLLYALVAKIDNGPIAYLKNFIAALTFSYGVTATVTVESIELPMSIGEMYYHLELLFSGQVDSSIGEAISYSAYNLAKIVLYSWWVVLCSSWLPLLFAGLCFWNITAIDLWEHSRQTEDLEEKQSCENIVSVGLVVLIAAAFLLAATAMTDLERPFVYAVMMGGALLQMINKKRSRFYLDAQRVLADLALILPFPIVYLMFYF